MTNGSKRWQFFVLISARANGNIFRVKKSHISLRCVFFRHPVFKFFIYLHHWSSSFDNEGGCFSLVRPSLFHHCQVVCCKNSNDKINQSWLRIHGEICINLACFLCLLNGLQFVLTNDIRGQKIFSTNV